jgi:3',5'-cyclic AMP phosphodiesterase CpdA
MSENRVTSDPARPGSPLTFAQLSDPHLSCPRDVALRDLLNKRAIGYLSWRLRRRARHRADVLAALVGDLRAARPDHVVVTGDLTHLGLPDEFEQVRRWLDELGPPAQVTVVPGNHEAYVRAPWAATLGRWAPYLASDPRFAAGAEADAFFPTVRVRGPAAFIGLSTARPSAPLLAVGRVGPAQLARLARVLAETRRQGLFRVLLVHHPPLAGIVRWRKRLTDGRALRAVLARHGVELVLHGHAHRTSIAYFETSAGRAPVVGVPSASALGPGPDRRARYHLYRLAREGGRWQLLLSVRGYAGDGGVEPVVPEGEPRRLVPEPEPVSTPDGRARPRRPGPPPPAPAP